MLFEPSKVIHHRTVHLGFLLTFKDVFGFFNGPEDKINISLLTSFYFMLNFIYAIANSLKVNDLMFLVGTLKVHQVYSSSKNLKYLKTVNVFLLFNLFVQ